MINFNEVLSILEKKPRDRSQLELQRVLLSTKEIPFFKNYILSGDTDVHLNCCRRMSLEQFDDQQIVFPIDSVGTKFYIVLQGKVGVYIRLPKKHSENEQEQPQNLENLTCVKDLLAGEAFGELALLNNKPRMASIIAHDRTYLAVLSKQCFTEILREKEQVKLLNELGFFSQIPIFSGWNFNLVKLLYLNTFRVKYHKGEAVFLEDTEPTAIFIITEGQFDIQKSFKKESEKIEPSEESQEIQLGHLRMGNQKTISIVRTLMSYSTNELFGEEDIMNGMEKRTFSAVCSSAYGECIMIKRRDFFLRIFKDDLAKLYLTQRLQSKNLRMTEKHQLARESLKTFNKYLYNDTESQRRSKIQKTTFLPKQQLSYIPASSMNDTSSMQQQQLSEPFTQDASKLQANSYYRASFSTPKIWINNQPPAVFFPESSSSFSQFSPGNNLTKKKNVSMISPVKSLPSFTDLPSTQQSIDEENSSPLNHHRLKSSHSQKLIKRLSTIVDKGRLSVALYKYKQDRDAEAADKSPSTNQIYELSRIQKESKSLKLNLNRIPLDMSNLEVSRNTHSVFLASNQFDTHPSQQELGIQSLNSKDKVNQISSLVDLKFEDNLERQEQRLTDRSNKYNTLSVKQSTDFLSSAPSQQFFNSKRRLYSIGESKSSHQLFNITSPPLLSKKEIKVAPSYSSIVLDEVTELAEKKTSIFLQKVVPTSSDIKVVSRKTSIIQPVLCPNIQTKLNLKTFDTPTGKQLKGYTSIGSNFYFNQLLLLRNSTRLSQQSTVRISQHFQSPSETNQRLPSSHEKKLSISSSNSQPRLLTSIDLRRKSQIYRSISTADAKVLPEQGLLNIKMRTSSSVCQILNQQTQPQAEDKFGRGRGGYILDGKKMLGNFPCAKQATQQKPSTAQPLKTSQNKSQTKFNENKQRLSLGAQFSQSMQLFKINISPIQASIPLIKSQV